MPFPTWLRSLFPGPENTPSHAEPQPGAQLDDPDPTAPDNGVRMHLAAHDPEFPGKREQAFATVNAAIDKVAQAHGFTKKPMSWAKTGPLGTVSIHLQRSRYGFDCTINLGFQPLDDTALGPWAQDDFIPLGRFYPARQNADTETIAYLDVHETVESLDQPMAVLSQKALPWLTQHLTDPQAHTQPFLSCPGSAT